MTDLKMEPTAYNHANPITLEDTGIPIPADWPFAIITEGPYKNVVERKTADVPAREVGVE